MPVLNEGAFCQGFAGTVLEVDDNVEAKGFHVRMLRGHSQHDHVDLVAVFDALPEINIRCITFDNVVSAFLQVPHSCRVMLNAKDLRAVDLTEFGVTR